MIAGSCLIVTLIDVWFFMCLLIIATLLGSAKSSWQNALVDYAVIQPIRCDNKAESKAEELAEKQRYELCRGEHRNGRSAQKMSSESRRIYT